MTSRKKSDYLEEIFEVAPDRGFAALVMGLKKPGYVIHSVVRHGTIAKVRFVKGTKPEEY